MYLVVFDDNAGLCMLFGKDPECEGAICITAATPLLFSTSTEARTAIKISRTFALLRQAQGKPFNDEFITYYKYIKVKKAEIHSSQES